MSQQNTATHFSINEMKSLLETMQIYKKSNADKGITLIAYSEEDEAAHLYLASLMKEAGLEVYRDEIGTLYARLQGQDPTLPAVATGSHLDTVPQGGAYDGALGVIAGFYALMQYKPQQLKRSLELIVFRAEESSRFGFSCIGSKVLTGKIDKARWMQNKDDEGNHFFEVLHSLGYQHKNFDTCLLDPNRYSAFVELHIEQGRRLENDKKTIGIVNGIAAPTRFSVTVKGHADHSGATPMYQRQDALVASASIITDINRGANIESVYGTVGTVGKLNVIPNSMNVIPGEVKFFVDIRGIDTESIQRVIQRLHNSIEKTTKDLDVNIDIQLISEEQPVILDDSICQVIEDICQQNNINYMTMLSGAGHDSMNMATLYPTAMIFTPSVKGISHHPDEFTEFSDIAIAADLLAKTLGKLASQ
ncbi:Zn-dependent hydrolase [Proteus myxofaciens]|uniref:N-carbamoyl-L-amino acid hydrolase n=1 Tax=Proteus myxofaciens ATCC 19692 TaxID=1354337 RepID=A0A198FJP5_9GAMM|nr:Zn-dependent hydrolase [Proteus myxofaciens]OAT24990.1 N-carbamoyl-L-amino acid hydrolase [Proteus myxofaciens ATCC 19692]